MNKNVSYIDFYKELESYLSTSTADKRKVWATLIIENNFELKDLSNLLYCDRKIALRFSWLLSEIGELNPNKLLVDLPYLLKQSEQIEHFSFIESFATYWLISGVPVENESKAIDLLFDWVLSIRINVTTKSRALKVLINLAKKYPELKNELLLCLNDQKYKHTKNFEQKAVKLLTELA
jgi:hypothetical protein